MIRAVNNFRRLPPEKFSTGVFRAHWGRFSVCPFTKKLWKDGAHRESVETTAICQKREVTDIDKKSRTSG